MDFFTLPAWHEYLEKVDNVPQISSITDFWLIGAAVFEMVIRLGALVAVGYIIYSGFVLMTSQGNPERISAGRSGILKASVGLVIVLLSANIVALIAGIFSESSDAEGSPIPAVEATPSTLGQVLQYVFVVAGAISVLMVVIGGFRYILSTGNPQQTTSAKNTIIYAIVGLIVSVSAFVIVGFVFRVVNDNPGALMNNLYFAARSIL